MLPIEWLVINQTTPMFWSSLTEGVIVIPEWKSAVFGLCCVLTVLVIFQFADFVRQLILLLTKILCYVSLRYLLKSVFDMFE